MYADPRAMALQQVEQHVRPIFSSTTGDGKDIMVRDFNISEKGYGSYWLLGILRWVMVLIFISFGIQKFTPQSADGIALYISNSPFVSWLSIFGIRGEAYLLGIIELTTAALLAAGAFIPILSALGSLMGIGTFAITWSFFFSTPGVVKWSLSTDPIGGTSPANSCTKMSCFFVFASCCFWHHCQRKSSRFDRIDVSNWTSRRTTVAPFVACHDERNEIAA